MGVVQFVNKKETLVTIAIFFTVMWEFSSLALTYEFIMRQESTCFFLEARLKSPFLQITCSVDYRPNLWPLLEPTVMSFSGTCVKASGCVSFQKGY